MDEDTLSGLNIPGTATAKKDDANKQLSPPGNAAMHAQAIFEVRTRGLTNDRDDIKPFNLFKNNTTKHRRVASQITRPLNRISAVSN